jgi:tripartite-type tricarboxylate transporter receptor subunit TctC
VAVNLVGGTTSASAALAFNDQTGTTYTFVAADAENKLVTASNASAQTYSIPTDATTNFAVGTQINIIQIGAGQVTIQAATSGTTTVTSTGATSASPKLRAQWSSATLVKKAANVWYVIGDLA